ncbi:MAG: hypothetical protein WCO00_00485 [Rhodospirillaceae bacterium]
MTDEHLASAVREAVARLNETLAEAARAGPAVTLRTTAHQSAIAGVEHRVTKVRILKQL